VDVVVRRDHQELKRVAVLVLGVHERVAPRLRGARGLIVGGVRDDRDDQKRIVPEEPLVAARGRIGREPEQRGAERRDHRVGGKRAPPPSLPTLAVQRNVATGSGSSRVM
jgi:hypothetical protein